MLSKAYPPSNAKASSDNTKPAKKCCCLNAVDSSAKLVPIMTVYADADEAMDDTEFVGEMGGDGYNGLGKGRLRVT